MPMFIQGLSGMNRRMYDGGAGYTMNQDVLVWNEVISWGAWALGFFQLFFIFNFFWSIKKGKKVGEQPLAGHHAGVAGAVAPPHGNFTDAAHGCTVGPYEYSPPGAQKDFVMQGEADAPRAEPAKV